jgi:hypothetical protein
MGSTTGTLTAYGFGKYPFSPCVRSATTLTCNLISVLTVPSRDNPELDEQTIRDDLRPAVNWSTLQSLFLDDCSGHVLFLLDCCYAGSVAKITNSSSIVEVIAAAGFEQVTPLRGSDSFTTFLIKVLKEVRSNETTIVASVLARQVSALLNNTDVTEKGVRVTPRHFPLHNGRLFIEIAPQLKQTSDPCSASWM